MCHDIMQELYDFVCCGSGSNEEVLDPFVTQNLFLNFNTFLGEGPPSEINDQKKKKKSFQIVSFQNHFATLLLMLASGGRTPSSGRILFE